MLQLLIGVNAGDWSGLNHVAVTSHGGPALQAYGMTLWAEEEATATAAAAAARSGGERSADHSCFFGSSGDSLDITQSLYPPRSSPVYTLKRYILIFFF